jgi:hypothetical protein
MQLHMQVKKMEIFAAWQIMLQLHLPEIDQNREFKIFSESGFQNHLM